MHTNNKKRVETDIEHLDSKYLYSINMFCNMSCKHGLLEIFPIKQ